MNTLHDIYKRVKHRLNIDAYQYAVTQTKKELSQAAEGMYHNLNSLD